MYPIILSIDTSCDDTSVAITQGARVLSNVIASQTKIHRKYGGVMPLMAKLEHHKLINPTYQEALKRAHLKENQIDAIAVTYGPGLAIALEVGIEFAKNLARQLDKPLIAVNHMKGHLYSSFANNSASSPNSDIKSSDFPALALLISGGHSDLVLLKNLESIEKIGQTVDDASGECLDKFARLLDLGYPGAPILEKLARGGDSTKYSFPLPMTQSHDFNYSFSGLKTAGRHQIEKLNKLTSQNVKDLAASFQTAVFKALMYKLQKAVKKHKPKSIWLGGGVSANLAFRKILRTYCRHNNLNFYYPKDKKLNTDNAAMIGLAAYFQFQKKDFIANFPELQRIPRLSL